MQTPLILKDDNGNLLPQEIQDKVNNFIDNLKNISWFKPREGLTKKEVDTQINFTLKCFGCEATIEYRKLETQESWDSARATAWATAWDSARATAWDTARATARDSARATARDSARATAWATAWDTARATARATAWDTARATARATARDSARATAWDSAWDTAWATSELLVEDNEVFKKKYPNGAFKQLFKLREMGLYPVGVVGGKFICYVQGELIEENESNSINRDGIKNPLTDIYKMETKVKNFFFIENDTENYRTGLYFIMEDGRKYSHCSTDVIMPFKLIQDISSPKSSQSREESTPTVLCKHSFDTMLACMPPIHVCSKCGFQKREQSSESTPQKESEKKDFGNMLMQLIYNSDVSLEQEDNIKNFLSSNGYL